jgi:DNA end-binding protein Ku
MRYADEIVATDNLDVPGDDIEVSEKELAMATQLIEALSGDFEPEKYHDEYREQLLSLIDQKAAGQEIVAQPEPEAPAKVLDLMAALEASLKRAGSDDGGAAADEDDEDEAATPSKAQSRPRKAGAKKAAKKKAPAKKAPPKKKSA